MREQRKLYEGMKDTDGIACDLDHPGYLYLVDRGIDKKSDPDENEPRPMVAGSLGSP